MDHETDEREVVVASRAASAEPPPSVTDETSASEEREASDWRQGEREQPYERRGQNERGPRSEPRDERRPPGAKGSAMTQAVEHAQEIINELKGAMDEMELVLELLEEAERQKIDDDREIKSLQRALERINRFRGQPARAAE